MSEDEHEESPLEWIKSAFENNLLPLVDSVLTGLGFDG